MTDEIKALHELITNVRLDLRELNVKMDGIKDLTEKVEKIQIVANKALQSTDSAHKRLDERDTKIESIVRHYEDEIRAVNIRVTAEVKDIKETREDDIKDRKSDRRWLIGTLITVGGLSMTVIGLVMKVFGN
ncbi:hypothetical protein EHS13_20230 [Paenibacillus psychroresistens]|uniref:DUF1515 domain-containing protein n=1 Tax=Paenibacillus psychroresistens TaxID=1778678 RepID=A0A6B8RMI1_9BACL|nr:hypothetical protein [Paenibacillus psychroresistens]QGQ97047.1 hypothetical protein EHS13_20230 [Paenibacillus psychroresistens]